MTFVKTIKSRRFQKGSSMTITTVAVIGIVILVNVILARYPARLDLTAENRFGLSPQTKEVLDKLDQDVEVTVFAMENSEQAEQIKDLLRAYQHESRKIKVKFVDPEKQPSLAQQYKVTAFGTVVLESSKWSRKIEPYNMYSVDPTGTSLEFRGEQAITRALIELVQPSSSVIYFLEGHGEGSLNSDFATIKSYLEGEGYQVKPLNLALEGKMPPDASLIVLGGPQTDLTEKESEMLQEFVKGQGKLLVLLEPPTSDRPTPNLDGVLKLAGVKADRDIVVDTRRAFFLDPLTPMPELQAHQITDRLIASKLAVALPMSRSIQVLEKDAAGSTDLKSQVLLQTSANSWGETDLQADEARQDDRDLKGPLSLAVAVWREVESPQTNDGEAEVPQQRVAVVVGDSTFVRREMAGFQGNVDFFMNAVDWLLGESTLISIRPKVSKIEPVTMSGRAAQGVFYGLVIAMPVVVAAAGAAVWLKRRQL